MRVDELMTSPAVTCRANDSVNVPARQMWECDCGAIPVVDDDGKVIGMITDRDICMAGYTQGKPYGDIPVSVAMSTGVVSCRSTDSIGAAEDAMRRHQIRRIPVVDDDGGLVGLLSLNDIATRASRRASGATELGADAVVRTLASICAHQPSGVAE